MQIPTVIEPASQSAGLDETAAQHKAVALCEEALEDPTAGSALLRAGAMLLAYLASHADQPDKALAVVVAEFSGNAHAVLSHMTAVSAGNA